MAALTIAPEVISAVALTPPAPTPSTQDDRSPPGWRPSPKSLLVGFAVGSALMLLVQTAMPARRGR